MSISIPITGDATGLAKAVSSALGDLDKLKREADDLSEAMRDNALTSKLNADQLKALELAAQTAHAKIAALTGATKQTRDVVDSTLAPMRALQSKLEGLDKVFASTASAERLSAQEMAVLRREYDATKGALDKLTAAEEKSTAATTEQTVATKKSVNVAAELDDKFGAIQSAVGGVSSALGVAGQGVADVLGGIADFAKSVASGGIVQGGVVALGAAVAYVITSIQAEVKAAAAAADVQIGKLQAARDAAIAISDELKAARTGRSVEAIQDERAGITASFDVNQAKNALADGIKKLGASVPKELSEIGMRLKVTADMSEVRKLYQDAATLIAGLGRIGSDSSALSLLPIVGMTTDALGTNDKSRLDPLSEGLGAALATQSNVQRVAKTRAEKEAFDKDMKALDASVDLANAAEAAYQTQLKAFQEEQKRLDAEQQAEFKKGAEQNIGGEAIDIAPSVASPEFLQNLADEGTQTIIDHTESVDPNAWLASMGLNEFGEAIESKANSVNEIDLRTPFEKIEDTLDDAKRSLAKTFENLASVITSPETTANVVSGAMGQGGFDSAGAGIGSAIGGFMGPVGSAIGGVIGALTGKLLDQLVSFLGIVTPLMDGLAVAVSALTPIFLVQKEMMGVLGDLFVQLAPLLLELATPIAALVLIFVRLVQLLMPFISIILQVVAGIVGFLTVITTGVELLDKYFFRPLISAVNSFHVVVLTAINGIIDLIRMIPGMSEFGTKADVVLSATTDPLGNSPKSMNDLRDLGDAIQGNTEETKKNTEAFNRTVANLPSGYKLAGVEFASSAAMGQQMMVINISNFTAKSSGIGNALQELRNSARTGTAHGNNGARRGVDDDRN